MDLLLLFPPHIVTVDRPEKPSTEAMENEKNLKSFSIFCAAALLVMSGVVMNRRERLAKYFFPLGDPFFQLSILSTCALTMFEKK